MTKSEYRGCHNCATDYHSSIKGSRTINVLLSPNLLLLARVREFYFEVEVIRRQMRNQLRQAC